MVDDEDEEKGKGMEKDGLISWDGEAGTEAEDEKA